MKQIAVDIFTSLLVLANYSTNILNFIPEIQFENFIAQLIPFPAVIIAIIFMALGILTDVIFYRTIKGSLIVIALHAFAYWTLTPNLLLLAIFVGVITFAQIFLRE